MVGVRDIERVVGRQHLAGKFQPARRLLDLLELDRGGVRVEDAALLEFLQHAANERIELFEGQLTLVLSDDAALRVDEHQRRPGAAAELVPDGEVPIVDDRMLDAVAQHRLAKIRRVALRRELGGVDPDHDHPVAIFALDLPQLRKGVHAVDSTEGPEVDDREPPPQIGDVQRPGDVDPIESPRKIGCPHAARVGTQRHPANGTGATPATLPRTLQ